MPIDLTAVLGLLTGFLVVGVIGAIVGDQLVVAANQTMPTFGNAPRIVDTVALGVGLCKIIVVVSAVSMVMVLFQRMVNLASRDEERVESVPAAQSMRVIEEPNPYTTPASAQYSNPFAGENLPENHYHNRFEAILEDESELESKGK